MAAVGLDLGGTKLAGGLFDDSGAITERRLRPLDRKGGPDVGQLVMEMLGELLAVADRKREQVTGVGVSVPGIAAAETGIVWAPNIAGWEEYPLKSEIETTLGDRKCRVSVESDRACSILGEQWKGAARGCKNAIFLAVGTGIGAGILADGRILRGAADIAGAVGWMALETTYRSEYVPCGCFEYYASGDGLARVAASLLKTDTSYSGPLRSSEPSALTARDVFSAFERDDPIARATIDTAIRYWGTAVANLVSIFNPERVIFGGGVFGPATRFLDAIRREAERWAQPISMKQVALVPARLGTDSALVGTGYLAGLSG